MGDGRETTVLLAADGLEALGLIRGKQRRIDLVFSDVVMPGLGGVELLEKARTAGLDAPFLFTSGYLGSDARGDVILTGHAHEFLSKPWTMEGLLGKVRELLDARTPRSLSVSPGG